MRPAALPKNVFAPVATCGERASECLDTNHYGSGGGPLLTTTQRVSPRLMAEPILSLSPGCIVTGRDSPVSAAWSTCEGGEGYPWGRGVGSVVLAHAGVNVPLPFVEWTHLQRLPREQHGVSRDDVAQLNLQEGQPVGE